MHARFLTFLTLIVLSSPVALAQHHVPSPRVDPADYLVRLGDDRYTSFDTEAAIEAFEEARTLNPANPDILIRLARTWNDHAGDLHSAGHEQKARAASRKAIGYAERLITGFPDDARSWFYMAASTGTLALFSDGREKLELGRRIEEYCSRSLELDSTYALPHVALGMYYREVARLGRLRRFVAKRLLGGLPDEPRQRAIDHMATAERLSPNLPVVVFQRARTLELLEGRDEAVDVYRRFARMAPMNSRDMRNLREVHARFEEFSMSPAEYSGPNHQNAGRSPHTVSNR